MQHEALQRVGLNRPRGLGKYSARVLVAGLPARANADAAEVDVLEFVLPIKIGGEEADYVHLREASVTRKLTNLVRLALFLRQASGEFRHDMA